MHLVQKQASVQKSSGPVSGRMQLARYQFLTFRLGCILPQTAWIILCKARLDPIWFWPTVSGVGQTDPIQKQTGMHQSSGPLLANASEPIWIGCESDPACLLGSHTKLLSVLDLCLWLCLIHSPTLEQSQSKTPSTSGLYFTICNSA